MVEPHRAWITLLGQSDAHRVLACTTFPLRISDIGRKVVLLPLPREFLPWIVIARLPTDHHPHPMDLTLSTGRSELILGADGRVVLRGEHIITEAQTTLRLRGGRVEIN
jgi:hypothetical protein